MITIKTTPDHEITVQSPFSPAFRDACKSIPGKTWNPYIGAWVYPATPVVALEISDRFTGQPCFTDDEFDELVKRGRNGTRLPDGQSLMPATAVPPPDSKRTPRGYQLVGYGHLLSRPANLLAHDMGVGKTKVVVDAIVNLRNVNLVLIVCPKTVIDVWPAEFAKDAAHPVNVVTFNSGTVATRTSKAKQQVAIHQARLHGDPSKMIEPLVLVINYEAIWRGAFSKFALGIAWDMIVLDEIHRIKSARGVASQFLAQLAKLAARRVGLTGTPMPHSPEDIFALFRFLDVSIFDKYVTHFRSRYIAEMITIKMVNGKITIVSSYSPALVKTLQLITPRGRFYGGAWRFPATAAEKVNERLLGFPTHACEEFDELVRKAGGYVPPDRSQGVNEAGIRNAAEFNAKVASITHFVTREDAKLELPPVTHQTRYVELGPETARVYRDLERDLVTQVKGGLVTAANAMVLITRLQQATSGIARIDREETRGEVVDVAIGNEKATALAELFGDLPLAEPVVVFGKFVHDLERIVSVAKECKRQCMLLRGGHNELAAWKSAKGGEVLAVQIKTGDAGVDFTRAAYCVYYSIGCVSPGHFDQTKKRIDRIGQTRPVTYIHLVAKGTVDETVYTALQNRQDVIQAVIEGITNETR